jgi:hypothetical protein
MNLAMLRDEYDRARHYTPSLFADLPEADVYWRPALQSSGIGWHRGHQAAVNQVLVRNVLAAEPGLNPQFDVLFDAVTLESNVVRSRRCTLSPRIVRPSHAAPTRILRRCWEGRARQRSRRRTPSARSWSV